MKLLNLVKENIAQMLVEKRGIKSIVKKKSEPVYNFTSDTGNYCLHSGVITHNCDTISMLASLKVWKPSEVGTVVQNKEDNLWELDTEEYTDSELDSYIV